MSEFSFWDIFSNLLLAARWTIVLSLVAFVGGGIVAVALLLARLSSRRWIRFLVDTWIKLLQGSPLLILLFMGFFGLPLLGIHVTAWMAAVVILIAYTSAFLADIWHGSIEAISRGQWAAAASLGLTTRQQFQSVIMPQAARIATPPTVGFLVQVVKNTSLTSIIGFVELSRTGAMLNNVTFEPFPIYMSVAVIYFVICFPMTYSSRILERYLAKGSAH